MFSSSQSDFLPLPRDEIVEGIGITFDAMVALARLAPVEAANGVCLMMKAYEGMPGSRDGSLYQLGESRDRFIAELVGVELDLTDRLGREVGAGAALCGLWLSTMHSRPHPAEGQMLHSLLSLFTSARDEAA